MAERAGARGAGGGSEGFLPVIGFRYYLPPPWGDTPQPPQSLLVRPLLREKAATVENSVSFNKKITCIIENYTGQKLLSTRLLMRWLKIFSHI